MADIRAAIAASLRRRLAAWRKDRRGNVAVMFAIAAPALFVAAGVGVDYSNLSSLHASLQTAADAAALSAAREMRLANLSAQTVQKDADNFALANLKDGNYRPEVSADADTTDRQVTVNISAAAQTYIIRYFDADLEKVSASATARIRGGDPLCVLGLSQKANHTVELSNSAQLQARGCVVYSNSTNVNGLIAMNKATLTASTICSAGGASGSGNGSFSPTPQTDCPVMADPLAGRPTPAIGTCAHNNFVVSGDATTLYPGTYCGGLTINNSANVTLAPGVYIIKNGPLYVTGGATMDGQNTGFYFTGTGAVLDLDTQSNVSLTAPKDGVMAGMLFWEAADVPKGEVHQIVSNNARTLLGTIYFPVNRLYVAANAPVADQSAYTVVVANQFDLAQGPTMVLNTNYGATDIPVPNGVGPTSATALIR